MASIHGMAVHGASLPGTIRQSMVASGSTLYADFPGYGLYSWNGSAWSQLTGDHPASMLVSGSTLYADFPGYGLCKWDGAVWSQIATTVPTGMIAGF